MGVRCTDSPLGQIHIRSKSGVVTDLLFREIDTFDTDTENDKTFLDDVVRKLKKYFDGDLTAIDDIPISPAGTTFQIEVWNKLKSLEPGETISYGELAKILGKPQGARAVGQAVGKNPICVIVPCHRVLGANRNLGGFSGGLFRKRFLLKHEGIPYSEPAKIATEAVAARAH